MESCARGSVEARPGRIELPAHRYESVALSTELRAQPNYPLGRYAPQLAGKSLICLFFAS